MDPLSISVGLLAIVQTSSTVFGYLSDVNEGGKDRQKLAGEVKAFHLTFKDLYDSFPITSDDEEFHLKEAQEIWAAPLRSLAEPGGLIGQVNDELNFLTTKLTPKPSSVLSSQGVKILRNLRWPFEKGEMDQVLARLGRLSELLAVHLGQANLLISKEHLTLGKRTNNDVLLLKDTISRQLSQERRRKVIAWVSTLDFYQKQEASEQVAVPNTGGWLFNDDDFEQWIRIDRQVDGNPAAGTFPGRLGVPVVEPATLAALQPSPTLPEIEGNDGDEDENKNGNGDVESEVDDDDSDAEEVVVGAKSSLHDSILWCYGIPGAGKTVLAAVTVGRLRRIYEGKNVAILVAFCTFDNPESHSASILMGSLLRQLVVARDEVPDRIQQLYNHHVNGQHETRPNIKEVCEALDSELRNYEKTFIVVDALDELPDQKEREALLDHLQALQGSPSIMLTSRPLPVIEALFGPSMDYRTCDGCTKTGMRLYYTCAPCDFDLCPDCQAKHLMCHEESHRLVKQLHCRSISITAQPEDVDNYITSRIYKSESLHRFVSKKEGLRETILQRVKEEAGGMFLLVRFHMDELADQQTINEVKAALEKLPHQVEETYHQAMRRVERLSPHRQEKVTKIIAYVAFAERPMTVPEMEHAVTVRPGSEDIDEDDMPSAVDLISSCAGIVLLDETGAIRMSHETASEYVRTNSSGQFPDPQAAMAVACLEYLKLKPFQLGPCTGEKEKDELDRRITRYPFLEYAALYWGRHVRKCDTEKLNSLALELLQQDRPIQSAVQVMWYTEVRTYSNWKAKDGVSAIHVASYFGLDKVVSKLIAYGADFDARDCLGAAAIIYAITEQHASVVEVLLHSGARADMPCEYGSTALLRATQVGNAKIISQLLTVEKIALNAQTKYGCQWSALMFAAEARSIEILSMLLKRPDLDINQFTADGKRFTTLMNSCCYGYADVVKLLLSHKAINTELRNVDGLTALIFAAAEGHTSVVEVLLDHGVNTDAQDDFGGRALLRAIDSDRVSVVRLMLDRGVKYDFKDWKGRNILHGCAINRHAELLRTILEHCKDLDINSQGNAGETPLHDAARTGSLETTRVLLDFGARTDIEDNAKQTPVRVARNLNQLDVLALLRQFRDKEELQDSSWVDVGHDGQARGADPAFKPPRRMDTFAGNLVLPLYSAVEEQSVQVLRARIWPNLEATSAEAEVSDGEHSRPQQVDVNEVDPATRATPLHNAVKSGRANVVALLLEAGANVHAQDNYGLTPLHQTGWARADKIAISGLLIKRGASLDAVDRLHRTPMDVAILTPTRDIRWALYLIDQGAVPETRHLTDLLDWAAYLNQLGTVKRLVELGAPIHMRDTNGNTPYTLAKSNGHDEVAAYLFKEMTSTQNDRPSAEEINMVLGALTVPANKDHVIQLKEDGKVIGTLPAPGPSASNAKAKDERGEGNEKQEELRQVKVEVKALQDIPAHQLVSVPGRPSDALSRREWTMIGIIIALLVAFLAVAFR